MKQTVAVLGVALLVAPALAAAAQQEIAKACNAAAVKEGLKGDKLKAYVKACLTAKGEKKPEVAATRETKAAAAVPAVRATTAPAQPSPASAATAPAPGRNAATDKKWLKCDEFARQSNVSPSRRKDFMGQCMAG